MPSSAVFHKFKKGKLHSGGPGGPVVKNKKQAAAIFMSEKRDEAEHGGRYPEKEEKKERSSMPLRNAYRKHKGF